MRHRRRLVSAIAAAVLAAVVLAPVVSSAEVPRPLLSADDDFPGVALPPSPVSGTLTYIEPANAPGADWDDVYAVHLSEGDTLRVSLTATSTNLFADLYGGGGWDDAVAMSLGPGLNGSGYPQELEYTAGTAGTYYLDVYTSGSTGSYTMTYSVAKAPISMKRLAGATRYSTAIAVSQAGWAAGSSPNVILATGANFADALAASALAGSYDCPILLTQPNVLTAGVKDEILRLSGSATANVMIMGSTAAVSQAVEDALKAGGRVTTKRIAGPTRYATAVEIGKAVKAHEAAAGRPWTGEAFVANGNNYPDALAAAPLAAKRKMPIILVTPTSIPAPTATAFSTLGVSKAYVVGGEPAVSKTVMDRLAVGTKTRISGPSRYSTAASLAAFAVVNGWATAGTVGVATGMNFPDALGGGPLIGRNGGVMLLSNKDYFVDEARFVEINRTDVKNMRAFGSDAALADGIFGDFLEAMEAL